MKLNKNFFLKTTIISLVIVSYFLGYIFRENASGGGLEFYNLSWPIIQSLKNDFAFTINNYGSFGDATIPFSHIINAYLNPFSNNITSFQLSITIISFLIFLIFAHILSKTFPDIRFIDLFLTSSVFLLLPFFRASAFWGKNENFGWLFLILSFYFFSEIKKVINEKPTRKDLLNIVFFCLTSACALYARQAFVFLPISFLLYLFFYKADKKKIITSILSFAVFAIPGILLFWNWGGLFDVRNIEEDIGVSWLNYSYILKNFPILLSFFGFYLLPILIIELINFGPKNFLNKYYKSFACAVIIFALLLWAGLLNYLGNYSIGGGAILKLNYLVLKNNFLLLLLFSSIGFSILFHFIKEDAKNNIIILLPIFIIYGFPDLLYQEYVEPLILIIFFLALKTNLQKLFFSRILLSNMVFLSYFGLYLLGSIYFKHFAFKSFEEWRLFLQ